MKKHIVALLILLVLVAKPALANKAIEVACTDGNISIQLNWQTKIGDHGHNVRHLFFDSTFGADMHVLLKIQQDQKSTGITNKDKQAKALILSVLGRPQVRKIMAVDVFPEGRDEVTGEWESISYSFATFKADVEAAAHDCEWDLAVQIDPSIVNAVHPDAPFEK